MKRTLLILAPAAVGYVASRSTRIQPEGLLSKIEEAAQYKDAFDIPKPQTKENNELEHYIRAFYTSPLFKLERFIISLTGNHVTDDYINNLRFKVGDKLILWEVIGRKDNEVLFRWKYGSANGLTWLSVKDNKLQFGSGVGHDVNLVAAMAHRLYSRLLIYSASKNL
jgi:hypothetical protein